MKPFSIQPYTSLADILLTDETCAAHPVAKNWFDQFRVVADDEIDDDNAHQLLQQQAMELKCTILHGQQCYCEDGSVRDVAHGLSTHALENFLRNFKQCVNERDAMIVEQSMKHMLDIYMAQQDARLAILDADKSDLNLKMW